MKNSKIPYEKWHLQLCLAENAIFMKRGGGAEGNRTPGLLIANQPLSQLSYSPIATKNNIRASRNVDVIKSL